VENRDSLIAPLSQAMKARTPAEWVALLEAAAVPCGPINRLDQVFADPQVKAHELAIALTRPDGTPTPGVANPIRLSASPVEYARAAPALGADTAEVLQRVLGLSADDIERLRGAGVVA